MPHYINTIGLAIRVETKEVITGASNIVLHVKKPNGKWYEWSGGVVYSQTKISYETITGDLDQAGHYIIYPTLTLGGWSGTGKPNRFAIHDPQKPDKRYNL
jgi:hypothetical protein